jgi:hypothetical protein
MWDINIRGIIMLSYHNLMIIIDNIMMHAPDGVVEWRGAPVVEGVHIHVGEAHEEGDHLQAVVARRQVQRCVCQGQGACVCKTGGQGPHTHTPGQVLFRRCQCLRYTLRPKHPPIYPNTHTRIRTHAHTRARTHPCVRRSRPG